MDELIRNYDYLNKQMADPFTLVIALVVLMFFVIVAISLGSGSGSGNGSTYNSFTIKDQPILGSSSMPIFLLVILALIILVNVLYFIYQIDVLKRIQDFFASLWHVEESAPAKKDSAPEPAPAPLVQETIRAKKQVFNIPGNYYSYDDAKAVCAAFNSKLATYDQIESAYNKGAEWCNYGWSSDQLALFPTQKKTYDVLQSKPGRGNDCGRPGINGGYIANPNVKFGVNCYGVKPDITPEEQHIMKTVPPYPQTAEEIEFQKKVDKMKQNIDNILLSPFNHNSWGM